MADPTDETLTDDRLRHLARHWPTEMRAVAAELLRAREALRAADELADEIEDHNDDIGMQALGYVARYRAARGER